MNIVVNQWISNYSRWLWLSILWMAAVIMAVPSVRADIYFWQDDQGVIHFSNQDAPPSASLYMREPAPVVASATQTPPVSMPSEAQDRMQAKLERTNRQLELALERVDEVTDKLRDSQQAAAVAAAVAQQAAQASIASAAQVAQVPQKSSYGLRERVVYYSAPSTHRIGGNRGFHHTPSNLKHHRFKYHKRDSHLKYHKRDSLHGKFGRSGHVVKNNLNRRHSFYSHTRPNWPVPHRKYIPKAYGIR